MLHTTYRKQICLKCTWRRSSKDFLGPQVINLRSILPKAKSLSLFQPLLLPHGHMLKRVEYYNLALLTIDLSKYRRHLKTRWTKLLCQTSIPYKMERLSKWRLMVSHHFNNKCTILYYSTSFSFLIILISYDIKNIFRTKMILHYGGSTQCIFSSRETLFSFSK